jgi:serpin B
MKTFRGALLMLVFAARLALPVRAMSTTALVQSNNAFALDLYAQLKTEEGNLFFSPYGISTCLAMTYAGARGDTAAAMSRTLHFPGDDGQLNASFAALQSQLTEQPPAMAFQLEIANGLWTEKSHPLLPAFLGIARKDYAAAVKQVDFRAHAEPIRKEINSWVEDRTKGKITSLLPPGSINSATRLALINAIYFKGKWTHPFPPANTVKLPFFPADHTTNASVPLMQELASYGYAETADLQLLQLPYQGGNLALLVLLPKPTDGLEKLEASLRPSSLDDWLPQIRQRKVNVFLPKFKLTRSFNLTRTLGQMGMAQPFTSGADFSGMDGARDFFISAVFHKAHVAVDEEGTEAAAATGTIMRAMAVEMPVVFRADHPFLFLIRDTQSGVILFLGRVSNPSPA